MSHYEILDQVEVNPIIPQGLPTFLESIRNMLPNGYSVESSQIKKAKTPILLRLTHCKPIHLGTSRLQFSPSPQEPSQNTIHLINDL